MTDSDYTDIGHDRLYNVGDIVCIDEDWIVQITYVHSISVSFDFYDGVSEDVLMSAITRIATHEEAMKFALDRLLYASTLRTSARAIIAELEKKD